MWIFTSWNLLVTGEAKIEAGVNVENAPSYNSKVAIILASKLVTDSHQRFHLLVK